MKRKEVLGQLREMETNELREQADGLKESLFRLKFKNLWAWANRSTTFAAREEL